MAYTTWVLEYGTLQNTKFDIFLMTFTSGHNYSLAGSEAASLAPTTSPYFLPTSSNAMEEVDSGLESMVTTTSDSSSNSSRSPPPPPPHYKLYTEL